MNAGSFVFLRLSYRADTFATGPDNYNINFRESDATPFGAVDEFAEDPRIGYESPFDVIPEPVTGWLVVASLGSLIGLRRRS